MLSNLYIFSIYYFFIPISLIGYGLFFFSINKKLRISSCLGYAGLCGIILICIYSYISSYFYAHNETHNFVLLIIGLINFFLFGKKNINKHQIILVSFLLIYFISILVFKTHDDFPYYHFQYSYYLTQMPSIVGLGNFNLGMRTPSSIFYMNSIMYLPITKYFMFHMTAFVFFLFTNMIFISKILNDYLKKNFNFLTFYYLLSFAFVNIFFYRISEHGTDRSAQILILLFIGEILFFLNFKINMEKILSKLFLLLGLIVSLKAFYILYVIFFGVLLLQLFNKYNLKKILYLLFLNLYLYLFLVIFGLILSINFINTGCLIYPINFLCFENFSWAIPKSEVIELNNWYEQWSKAGAGPNFRVEDPESYIKNFNWVENWFKLYFFTKVSDFLLGLIFLLILIYIIFRPYKKFKNKNRNTILVIFSVLILFIEWFVNHPSLRYGGYCLVASLVFVLISLKIEKSNLNFDTIKKRISYFIIFTLIVFVSRNISRIYQEHEKYHYNPIKNVYFKIEDKYFDLNKKIVKLKYNFHNCNLENNECDNSGKYSVKKVSNRYIFSLNKND